MKSITSGKITKVKRPTCAVYARQRTTSERVHFTVPADRVRAFCQKNGYGDYDRLSATHKRLWQDRSDTEILLAYNAQLRGFANYYVLASAMKHSLKKLALLWETSLYKTFAGKYQTSVREIRRRYRVKDQFGVSVPSKG